MLEAAGRGVGAVAGPCAAQARALLGPCRLSCSLLRSTRRCRHAGKHGCPSLGLQLDGDAVAGQRKVEVLKRLKGS